MIRFHIVTLFPDFFDSVLRQGLMAKAIEKGLLSVELVDPRSFSKDRHRHVDDRPYGGSPGMVMQPEPVCCALRSIASPGRMLAMAPSGYAASQGMMRELAKEEDITILCGRYEGFDARLYDLFPLEPVSVGDIVLNGGETAALALLEAVSRLVPGFMGKEESGDDESYSCGLLEYPHFTRPPLFEGHEVPEVLLHGNHASIAAWRRARSVATTFERRPDLLDEARLTAKDRDVLKGMERDSAASNIWLCLLEQDAPKKWQKTAYDCLFEQDIAALCDFGRQLGLAGVKKTASEEDLAAIFREAATQAGQEPHIAAVAPWPEKEETLSGLHLRAVAQKQPLVLVAGRHGYLSKAVLRLCSSYARLPHSLKGCRLCARDCLTILLDRIAGEYW